MPAKDKNERTISANVICPHYRSNTRTSIYCDGFLDNTSLILSFGNTGRRKDYLDRFCRREWQSCPRAIALNDPDTFDDLERKLDSLKCLSLP